MTTVPKVTDQPSFDHSASVQQPQLTEQEWLQLLTPATLATINQEKLQYEQKTNASIAALQASCDTLPPGKGKTAVQGAIRKLKDIQQKTIQSFFQNITTYRINGAMWQMPQTQIDSINALQDATKYLMLLNENISVQAANISNTLSLRLQWDANLVQDYINYAGKNGWPGTGDADFGPSITAASTQFNTDSSVNSNHNQMNSNESSNLSTDQTGVQSNITNALGIMQQTTKLLEGIGNIMQGSGNFA